MSDSESASEVRAMHDVLVEHIAPKEMGLPIEADGETRLVVAPAGHQLHSLEPALAALRAAPRRTRGTSAHQTIDSFVAHALHSGNPARSAVFVDVSGQRPKVVAVYDYDAPEGPGWREHRATLDLPFSEEFVAWVDASKNELSQETFANFLEKHLLDVLDPVLIARDAPSAMAVADSLGITYATQAALLGLSRNLDVKVNQRVEQTQKLQSGEGTLHFEESHTTKSENQVVKVPGGFCLALGVFRGDDAKSVIPVRLRYRVKDQRVVWTLALHRIDEVLRAEVEAMVQRLAAATKLRTYAGVPEAPATVIGK